MQRTRHLHNSLLVRVLLHCNMRLTPPRPSRTLMLLHQLSRRCDGCSRRSCRRLPWAAAAAAAARPTRPPPVPERQPPSRRRRCCWHLLRCALRLSVCPPLGCSCRCCCCLRRRRLVRVSCRLLLQQALQLCCQAVPLPLCFESVQLCPLQLVVQPTNFLQVSEWQQGLATAAAT